MHNNFIFGAFQYFPYLKKCEEMNSTFEQCLK